MKKRADAGRLAPWEEELICWTDEDAQFWNFKDDFKDMKLDEIPRFKTPLLHLQLFVPESYGLILRNKQPCLRIT